MNTENENSMSPDHPHGKPDPRWITDDGRCLLCADSYHKQRISELTILCETLYAEMNWLDQNCSFVADAKYNLGPFKVGELRLLAQAGIKADEPKVPASPRYVCWICKEEQTGNPAYTSKAINGDFHYCYKCWKPTPPPTEPRTKDGQPEVA